MIFKMPHIKAYDAENDKQQVCAVFNNNDNWRALAIPQDLKNDSLSTNK